MNKCARCGRCCCFFADGKWHQCKYLKKLSNGTYMCSVFPNRIGKIIYKANDGTVLKCGWREDVLFNYKNCPYNNEKWSDISEESYKIGKSKLNN